VTIAAWIALGIVAFAFVLLALLALVMARRVGKIKGAATALQARAKEAEALAARLEQLQPRVEEIALRIEETQAKFPRR
jgi:peptidoglycan hydrolase CwlO-like protein